MADMPKLQDYADAYWQGDRQKALYDLLFYASAEKGKMDDYIDELSTEEANFVYCSMVKGSHYAYGSQDGFRDALRAEMHAANLDMELDDIRANKQNPFLKPLLVELVKMVGVIALIVPVTFLNKAKVLPINPSILNGIPAVLSGLVALDLGSNLINFFRYRKARKLAKNAPIANKEAATPSFEECLEYYQMRKKEDVPKQIPSLKQPLFVPQPTTTVAEANAAVKAAGKQNWVAIAYLFLAGFIYFLSMFAAYMHWIAGVIFCAGGLALAIWQLRAMFKACKHAKDALKGHRNKEPSEIKMHNRQGFAVMAFIFIAAIYVVVSLIGIFLTIAIITAAK